ncbi:MAG: GSCFA domain-containing protein [Bacteroidales bacterium]|jgi:hypothetical protein|nr:GSCFA domain-containing protein [Bacteroidales bacterium]HOL98855.1 GSCFA domain-containing protein [Bacteroidales bacterium]HOM37098.1 GSCFA domain-containing protein [Bacteroidales bacterium]HPD24705.1 GSCFA domain-containing protein [Bacteroidales bacterium]HRT00442.1 GSCFA domain-containing protein [Bacteroidales bacterium]
MKLITYVDIPNYDFKINYDSTLIFSGSCFAENMGEKLSERKFYVSINPTGINYNPISLANSIKRAINQNPISENELFLHEGVWHHFDFHSRLSNTDRYQTLNQINTAIKNFSDKLKSADFIFISFGTAMVFELKKNSKTVANCHKLPAKNFTHRIISTEEFENIWENLLKNLFSFNKKIKIIFTVSPVRYFNEGAISNSFSKAILFTGLSKLLNNSLFKSKIYYFPAYEILIDELRDYRYYTEDLVHPSNLAINYIYQKFSEACFDKYTQSLIKQIEEILMARLHRPFNPDSNEYRKFCSKNLEKINVILQKHPDLNFSEEINYFKKFA